MLFIKTDTRELTINNENGEKYFDAILSMMLEERKPSTGGYRRHRMNALHTQKKPEKRKKVSKVFCI